MLYKETTEPIERNNMKAELLKSGKYRAKAYDYTDKNGKQHYKSFTADSKKEAERLATEYKYRHEPQKINEKMTVGEAIDRYIELRKPKLSPTTVHAYEIYRKYAFPDLMEIYTTKVTNLMLEEALSQEMTRIAPSGKKVTAKTVKNEFSLVSSALKKYAPNVDLNVELPQVVVKIPKLPLPEEVYDAVKGSSIELAAMLAMWLSFSVSEIKGLKRSSIDGDYIQIDQVMVRVGSEHIEKELAKVDTRTRRHRIPPYIASLIASLPKEQEYLVPMTGNALNGNLKRLLDIKGYRVISFHKLRHINASTMALLQIPTKYAQERGGWSTPQTMERVYQHTFDKDRIQVDDIIDDYFNGVVGMVRPKVKYKDFIKFMNIENCERVKELFEELITYSKK